MNLSSRDIDFLYFMKIRKSDVTKRSAGVLCFYEGYHKSGVLHRHLLTKSRKDKKKKKEFRKRFRRERSFWNGLGVELDRLSTAKRAKVQVFHHTCRSRPMPGSEREESKGNENLRAAIYYRDEGVV